MRPGIYKRLAIFQGNMVLLLDYAEYNLHDIATCVYPLCVFFA